MKAVVQYDLKEGAVELREVQKPVCARGEVILKVKAVAVCGSDLHQRANRQSWPVNAPVILGHEFAGEIADVGPDVTDFSKGDRVASETAAIICGKCILCKSGQYQLCRERKGFGYGTDGAMAEYVKVPERILHRLPDNVSYKAASLVEPSCVAYSAVVVRGQPRVGDTAVVIGPGPIGLLCTKMASLAGATTCILAGLSSDGLRLELGKRLGATHTVAVDKQDLQEVVQEITGGFGADLIIDAAGVSQSLKDAINIVKPAGTITKVGWGPQPLNYSLDPLVQKAADIRGSFSHNFPIWERVIRLIATGHLDVDLLITNTYSLDQWPKAFDDMEHGANIKSVILPDGEE